MRVFAWIVVLSLLSGCEALNLKRPVPQEQLTQARKIGVLSALGERMHGVHVGTTVFSNWRYDANVAAWKIDELAAQDVVSALNAQRQGAAGRIVPARSVEELYPSPRNTQIKKDDVFALAATQGYDTLVLIRRDRYDNAPFFEPGYGLFYRSMLGSTRPCAYAMYTIDVFDVKTRQSLGWERSNTCVTPNNDIPFKKTFEELSPAERERMKALVEAEVKRTLQDTLRRVGVLGAR